MTFAFARVAAVMCFVASLAGASEFTASRAVDQPGADPSPQRTLLTGESLAPVIEKVAPAVVRIVSSRKVTGLSDLVGANGRRPQPVYPSIFADNGSLHYPGGSLGSGVIVTENGYILTNCHLVGGPRDLVVTLQDGREFVAKVVGLDNQRDVAVIKVDAQQLPTVPFADSGNVRVGDLVLAVGHPFGVGQTVTHGIVSATGRGGMGIEDYEDFIQTDAPINPGNSGGALVDSQGRLIGINTAILSPSGGNLGIGFAVPSDLAHRVMTDLMSYGCVFRGYLGIEGQDLTRQLAKEFGAELPAGVLVGGVVPKGPAELAGVQVGDVILDFGGKHVRGARELRLAVADGKPCQPVLLTVLRNGSSKSLRVVLSQAAEADPLPMAPRSTAVKPGAMQSVTLIDLSPQVREYLNIPPDVQGTAVLDLHAYSAAARAGLRPADIVQSVNRKPIATVDEVMRLTESAAHKRTLLRVWSNGTSRFIVIDPTTDS